MQSFLLFIVGIFATTPSIAAAAAADNTITITTEWNGTVLADEDIVNIKFSVTSDNELQIEFDSAFYNSPIPPEPMIQSCPERPYNALYNYEVVEIFFLNDAGQYLEVEVSPRGRYLFLLLDGERNDVLSTLPVFPDGVTDLVNLCLENELSCTDRWSAKITIPQEYMPMNVTKMNAYAIRGPRYGEATVPDDDKIYLALHPNEVSSANPDFHYLDAFKPVPEELTSTEYLFPTEFSELWKAAMSTGRHTFNFDIVHPADCTSETVSTEYSCRIVTDMGLIVSKIRIEIAVEDSSEVVPVVMENLQTQDSESVWVTFSNDIGHQVRVGVNPDGVSDVHLLDGDTWLTNDEDIFDVECDPINPNTPSTWKCVIDLPVGFLPANVTYFQMLHIHSPLKPRDESGVDASKYEFIGAICPGNPYGNGNFDFKGCGTDARMFVDPSVNSEISFFWLEALENGSPSLTGPSTGINLTVFTASLMRAFK